MPQYLTTYPKTDCYSMPAEYHVHSGTWMLWPERPDNWRLGAKPAQRVFTEVATAISFFEPVTVGVSVGQYQNARRMLPVQVRVVELASNDAWMRDCGPTFVSDGKGVIRGIDWEFNAWGGLTGGLYFPWDLDQQVARKVCEIERVDCYRAPFVLEGGSFHVDGQGTLMTTEECLLNSNRNPSLSKVDIESLLENYLGITKIIWLRRGVYNDETNGHIDNLACFVAPGQVALTWTDVQQDPQYDISSENEEILRSEKDAKGQPISVHRIQQPGPIYITKEEAAGVDFVEGTLPRQEGDRLAASYINFYFCNGAAIVPVFGDKFDEPALRVLQALIPDRKLIPIMAREILLGGGNIHCITQQQPK